MSLLDAIRAGVKVANTVTKPLQATVMYSFCTGNSTYGPTFAAAVPLKAIVDQKQQQVRTKDGVLEASNAQVTFLDVAALVTATSGFGVRENDEIVLPDGSTGAIRAVGGFIDAGTGHPVATDVWLG